jgi:hypothetical protein
MGGMIVVLLSNVWVGYSPPTPPTPNDVGGGEWRGGEFVIVKKGAS